MVDFSRCSSFIFLILFSNLVFSSCASVAPFGSEGEIGLAEDERRLWNRGAEEAKKLDGSGQLDESPGLVRYVNLVAGKLIPRELGGAGFTFQVKIIKNPLLNAFALPQGRIYIHSGMLARMENEAQLAAVIAHELVHITHRHVLQHFRTIQNTSTALAVLGVLAMPAGAYGNIANILGAIGSAAAVSGYSRDMEREADTKGFELVVNAGYDPTEAPKLFEHVKKDLEEQKINEPFFFGSHPRLSERQETYTALVAKHFVGKSGYSGEETFAAEVEPLLLDDARMNLSLGRWSWAEGSIRKSLSLKPETAESHYLLGELFRRRGNDGDLEKAEQSYQVALEVDNFFPSSYKGLGMIHLKRGEHQRAKDAFERYLALAPKADDRGYIEQYLQNLKGVQ